jgi:AbrB family looped-hinge helix DNA binding protein
MEGLMQLAKILARGQVTVPRAIRQAVGLRPGDVVAFDVTADGRVEIRPLPRLTLAEALERYRVDDPAAYARDPDAWKDDAARDVIGR